MSIELTILKATGRLEPFETLIQTSFQESIEKIQRSIALPKIDVVVADYPDGAIPEIGVCGNAYTEHLVFISIDPNFPEIEKTLAIEIQSTLAHELHHCARMHTVGYGKTLLEALVSEGLADHFDIEINKSDPKPWCVALKGVELERIKKMAQAVYNNVGYSHSDWFFGSTKLNIPRWSGYSIGFDLVKSYLNKTGKSASELVSTDAQEFII